MGTLALISNVVGAPSIPTHCLRAMVFTEFAWSSNEYAGFTGVRLSVYCVKLKVWLWAINFSAVPSVMNINITTNRLRFIFLSVKGFNFSLLLALKYSAQYNQFYH
jgi:hypothetical protein